MDIETLKKKVAELGDDDVIQADKLCNDYLRDTVNECCSMMTRKAYELFRELWNDEP